MNPLETFLAVYQTGDIAVYDPCKAEVIARVKQSSPADVDTAVATARKALDNWRKTDGAERGRLLWKLADLIQKQADDLALLEALNVGKPIVESRTADLPNTVAMFRYMAGWADKLDGRTIPMPGFHSYTLREPVGVIAAIIPWNFPLMMAAWKLAPALAAGCTVLLKPAEQTPLSALWMAELIDAAGFPHGVVQVLTGDGKVGVELAKHPVVNKVAFTGSVETAEHILWNVAQSNLKKVSLELGGKSANIVFADTDRAAAARESAMGIFYNAGQCCSAGSRILVEQGIFDDFVARLHHEADKVRLGYSLDPTTTMGAVVSKEQWERVCRYGGKPAYPDGLTGWFIQPTILTDVPLNAQTYREEIFGPVACVVPFKDEADAIRMANDSNFGLAAGLWTQDASRAHRVAGELRAGTVWINSYNVWHPAMPFGGVRSSGWGREMGAEALELYTEVKSVCQKI